MKVRSNAVEDDSDEEGSNRGESLADFFRNSGPITNSKTSVESKKLANTIKPTPTPSKPINTPGITAKPLRSKLKSRDVLSDSDSDEEASKRGESLADFFRNSGPEDSKNSSGSSINVSKSFSKLSVPAASLGSEPKLNVSSAVRRVPERYLPSRLKPRNTTKSDASDSDDGTTTKESSLAEFLSSTGPEERHQESKPSAQKKSFLNFSQSIDLLNPKSRSKSNLGHSETIHVSSKPTQLVQVAVVNHLSEFMTAISNEESLIATQSNGSINGKTKPASEVPTVLNNGMTSIISNKSSSAMNLHALNRGATIQPGTPKEYLKDDSFASLPSFKAESGQRLPPVFIELPLASLALNNVVKELTSLDREYRRVFVAPTAEELPILAKRQKKFACASCQVSADVSQTACESLAKIGGYSDSITTTQQPLHTEIISTTEPLSENALPIEMVERVVAAQSYQSVISNSELDLQGENEILRIELAKEIAKREKVDLDRRVMHYQYDKLIRITHRKLVERVNKERQDAYEKQ